MRRRAVLALAALVAAFAARPAHALDGCQAVSASRIIFGEYDPQSPIPLDSAGTFGYLCSGVAPGDSIIISLSRGGSTSSATRRLSNASATLDYDLYLDAARTLRWGDGTDGTVRLGPFQPASGNEASMTIFARIPARQNVPIGSYTDTITATILY